MDPACRTAVTTLSLNITVRFGDVTFISGYEDY